jgi:integrase
MVLFMTRPSKRSGSANGQFKKRVPSDVLKVARGKQIFFSLPKALTGDERILISVKVGTHVEFSLRTADVSLVKQRLGAAAEQFERACAAYREGPRRLTLKQCHALAGILYSDLATGIFEDDPISATWWRTVHEVVRDILTGPTLTIDTFPDEGRLQRLDQFVGPFIDPILSREGVIPADEDRPALLRAFAKAVIDAAKKLERNAEGDFADDPAAARFPKWEGVNGKAKAKGSASSLTATKLFELWQQHPDQKTVTPSTLASYSAVFENLKAFLVKRHGAEPAVVSLARDDFRAFIDMRSEEDGVSAKTINGSDLAAINAVFNWAVDQDKLEANPADRVKRKVRKGTEAAKNGRKTINDAEARAILKHAFGYRTRASKREDPKLVAAKRWVPWLMAYTGTRVGEVAQLRKSDVAPFDGHPAIAITVEAGTVKSKSKWHIPLHPHLIQQGFLKFVEAAGDGQLFLNPRPDLYRADAKPSRTRDPRGILGPLQSAKNKLAAFVREVMPDTGNGPSPNHGWRHRFKAVARENGIDLEVRNAFADHASTNVAGNYGKDELYEAMVAALPKIPRYEINGGGDE